MVNKKAAGPASKTTSKATTSKATTSKATTSKATTKKTTKSKTAQPAGANKDVTTIDQYIALFPAGVQTVLRDVRETIKSEAPDAEEVISYRMPAFKLHGILLYFAAFKQHIGLYPPVSGDKAIEKAIAPYAGPKGNLQFPLDAPMPLALIRRIARLRVKQNLAKRK